MVDQVDQVELSYLAILVGGWPTPLKNDGARQLGSWNSQYMEKKKHVPNHQPEYSACSKPPTSLHSLTTAGRVLGQRLFQTTNQYPWRIHGAA